METTENACFHCGEPIPENTLLFVLRDGQKKPVCCAGCQAVAELIFSSGLGRYYQFRQDLGRKAEQDLRRELEAWQGCDDRESLWGAELAEGRRDLLLQTEGIRCAACAWLIRSHLENAAGVHSVQVDTATGYTRIIWSPALSRLSRLAASLMELGYKPHLPLASAEEQGRQQERRDSMKRLGVAGLGMMQVMMYAVGLYAGDAFGIAAAERSFLEWVSLMVTLPVLLYSGRIFFHGAWRSIRAGRPGMDVPVALAISLAFVASCYNFFTGRGEVWFDSVVMFIFFLSLGRHIEMMLRHRNLQAGTALARLLPEWAERITGQGRERVPSSDLVQGDRVLVRVGESFPADGALALGSTEVDEALLTGESRAIERHAGDAVIAGTINLSQPVEVEVTASGDETTVSALGRLLLLAQSRRPSSSAIPQWLVPVFIVSVLVIAGLTWLGWQTVDPDRGFSAMLSVLVASCPCALSLALPVVYAAASHRLLDEGILLTRGDALDALTRIDTVVFDKTGTLTRGTPEITSIEMNPERATVSEDEALEIAAALEASSAHPIARAFRETADAAGARENTRVSDLKVHAASGVEGRIRGMTWKIGKADFACSEGRGMHDDSIWLSDESGWVARFGLQDALRQGAGNIVEQLRSDHLAMAILSGDSKEAVEQVAARLQITDYQARQTPQMKLEKLAALRSGGQRVLMIGDGVNDAPVLAAADVSMTVKGGAELANSAADLILTSDSLDLVSKAMETARRTRQLVRQNLTWAVVYNVSVMPLAVSGALKPWMAALGMSLSSLLVVANASRLVRRGQGERHTDQQQALEAES
ncbi:MAG: cadmium-translocating P-type ATPase [Xanthomonadales bacterium]|nr:cadmium-translocating P-type ATPase [Gammaproteobacteria bacterium]NNK50581.1 cadmium-translocating P-type ATPase [Xanthomonadales bacterium]